MRRFTPLLATLLALFTFSCQSNAEPEIGGEQATAHDDAHVVALHIDETTSPSLAEEPAYRSAAAQPTSTTPVLVKDLQYDLPALTIDVPQGYNVEGGIIWKIFDGIYYPTADVRITNRRKDVHIHFQPQKRHLYIEGPNYAALSMYQPRPNTPVMSAAQGLQQLVFRDLAEKYPGIRIVDISPQENSNATGERKVDGAVMTLTHTRGNITYTTKAYAQQNTMSQEFQMMYGTDTYTYWNIVNIYEITAPASIYAEIESEASAILNSAKYLDSWYAHARQVDQNYARAIDNQAAISARNHQERMRSNQASFDASQQRYREMQQVYDQSNAAWQQNQNIQYQGHQNNIDAIYGRERYVDPATGTHYTLENPNQYNWIDNQGNIISTDDPMFNPRVSHETGRDYRLLKTEE